MPYIIRKKIRELHNRPLILEILLDNDKFVRHYNLDYAIPKVIRATVNLIVDQNDCIICFMNNKKYDFEVRIKTGPYINSNEYSCDRSLILPTELVNDYAIDANMGIELVLNEIILRTHGAEDITQIFSERMEKGVMEFTPKEISGEAMPNLELLITTKFSDDFFDKLAFEINSAFRVGLFTATMVLVRKLFEKLIIELLRSKFGMPEMELFYSKNGNGFLNLSDLIRNLRTKIDYFKPYDFFKLEREKESFVNFLWDIQKEGGASVHSFEPVYGRPEIDGLKPSINKYSDLLVRLIQKVKETPQ